MLLLTLAACIDYAVEEKPGEPVFDDGDPVVDSGDTADSAEPPPEEVCNGVDDDGNGQTDEGFADTDADGTADCLDTTCVLDLGAPSTGVDVTCQAAEETPPADPWNIQLLWERADLDAQATPIVADLDQDGVPEVIVSEYDDASGPYLWVLDGDTGATRWSVRRLDAWSGVAAADLDGDGDGEIVAVAGNSVDGVFVVALEHDGTEAWRVEIDGNTSMHPFVADLDADGDAEVLVDTSVLDGATGALEWELALSASRYNWTAPIAADYDLDGLPEVMRMGTLYDDDGSELFSCGINSNMTGSYPQPIQADADPYGEWLAVGYGSLALCDDDGTRLWSRTHSMYGSPAAVTDQDGDGVQEIAFVEETALYLLDADGTERWSATIDASTGLAGAAAWDIDLDGAAEILVGDDASFAIYDGATGAVVYTAGNGRDMSAETPAVADVDGDGRGEIVVGGAGRDPGVRVFASADGDWPSARPVYNQGAYLSGVIADDLSVVAAPPLPWADGGKVRGQGRHAVDLPNLRVAIVDVCVASCEADGTAAIAVEAWNDGAADVPAGTEVVVYGSAGGAEAEVARLALAVALAPGEAVQLEATVSAHAVNDGIRAAGDVPAALAECHELDNTDEAEGAGCL